MKITMDIDFSVDEMLVNVDGTYYKAIPQNEGTDCVGCDFAKKFSNCINKCSPRTRKDNKNIVWKKLEYDE
jgi:hypothetical protein